MKVIDRATFRPSLPDRHRGGERRTELIAGKTVEQALSMSGQELSAPLGALPPMKIHCAQLVENALRSALIQEELRPPPPRRRSLSPACSKQFQSPREQRKVKIVLTTEPCTRTPK